MPWIESPECACRSRSPTVSPRSPTARSPGRRRALRPLPVCRRRGLLSLPGALVVALDGVTDPRNLGAIVRSCECLGAHGLVIPKHGSAGVSAVVAKASSGASSTSRSRMVTNLAELLRRNKRPDLWSYAAAEDGEATPDGLDLTGGVVLVLGAEGSGIRPLVRQRCDGRVRIPMHGAIGSLNVAVAASLLLYEADRQRRTRAPRRACSADTLGEHVFVRVANAPQRTCVLPRTCYVRPHRGLR